MPPPAAANCETCHPGYSTRANTEDAPNHRAAKSQQDHAKDRQDAMRLPNGCHYPRTPFHSQTITKKNCTMSHLDIASDVDDLEGEVDASTVMHE
jgi:hypothetical protein